LELGEGTMKGEYPIHFVMDMSDVLDLDRLSEEEAVAAVEDIFNTFRRIQLSRWGKNQVLHFMPSGRPGLDQKIKSLDSKQISFDEPNRDKDFIVLIGTDGKIRSKHGPIISWGIDMAINIKRTNVYKGQISPTFWAAAFYVPARGLEAAIGTNSINPKEDFGQAKSFRDVSIVDEFNRNALFDKTFEDQQELLMYLQSFTISENRPHIRLRHLGASEYLRWGESASRMAKVAT
jgi:hypothetical protein